VLDDFSAVVNLDIIEKNFNAGEVVNSENLLLKGLVSKIKGRTPKVKILGSGKLSKKLVFENCKVSASAKTIIEKAGGSIK
jgi:large subunit ribosomal protein L15